MTVGFISPALRRNLPTDLTVRADRATLSDAAVEFAAADKALLKTASDPAFFTLAGKTVSIWVKLDDSDDRLIFKQDENTLRYDPNEDAFIWDYNGFEDSYQTADGTDLTDWVHIVIVARSAGVKIYLNGTLDTNDDSEIPVTGGDGNLYQFGGQLNGVWFDGKFDSSAIWEREFTDAEVLQLYNDGDGFTYSQLPANLETGILHAWDFSARSSTGVWFDAVGGANLTEEFGDIIGPTTLNGGFEDWTSGAPDEWNSILVSGGASVTEETSIVKSGASAARCEATGGSDSWFIRNSTIDVVAGRLYRLGAWIYGVSGSMGVRFNIGDDSGVTIRNAVIGQWTYLERIDVAGAGGFAGFRRGGFDTHVIIDDVTFQAQDIPLTTGITAGLARAYGTDVGDSVSLWLDRSSEGNDLAQTAIVSQPMLVEVDGRKQVKLDGVDDHFALAESFAKTTDETWTVSFVATPASLNTSVNTAPVLGGETSYISLLSTGVDVRLNGSGNEGLSSISLTAAPMVVVVVRTPTTLQAFVNGSAGSVAAVTNDHHASGLSLVGQRLISGGGNFDGEIGEIIITKRAISTTERIRIERSLAAKYGITLAS